MEQVTRWDRIPPCSRNSSAVASPPSSPQGPAPSTRLSFPVPLLEKPRRFPAPTCCHRSPPLSERPSARFAAQFPVTPSCQVQYLPLAAPMFSEQGITISLQVSPRFPALSAQLQALGETLPPSATCSEHTSNSFSPCLCACRRLSRWWGWQSPYQSAPCHSACPSRQLPALPTSPWLSLSTSTPASSSPWKWLEPST